MTTTEPACTLCGLGVSRSPVENENGDPFCCVGCREVHDALSGRVGESSRYVVEPDEIEAVRGIDEPGPIPDHHETTFLRVDGMHCSTCEVFIESLATRHDDVGAIDASYVTDTVRVSYDPHALTTDELLDFLSGFGYSARRRDDRLAEQESTDRTLFRIALGGLFGMMVMFQYVLVLYPTYFGARYPLYDERTAAFLTDAVTSTSGSYIFVMIWVLTSVVLFVAGGPILKGAYVSLRARAPNMDLLVALAAVSAYVYSTLAFAVGSTHVYYDVTVAIIVVVTVGSYYETGIKRAATERLADVTIARADEARRIAEDGSTTDVDIEELEGGDAILVRGGDRVPVDGVIDEGSCTVDESVVTGESLPITKHVGDGVVGGSVIRNGSAVVEVDEDARSSIDRIESLVWNLQSENHGIQKLADRLATIFVPTVVILASVVALGYLVLLDAGVTTALLVGLTVLIVSCPCALGLATPMAVASGVRESLEKGIVVFDDTVFERLREVDVVIFDKTGTLTTGQMAVREAHGSGELFSLAAALERRSAHPVADAIAAEFEDPNRSGVQPVTDGGVADELSPTDAIHERGGTDRAVTEFREYANGVGGVVDGTPILVGHPDRFDERGWTVPERIEAIVDENRGFDRVPVVVGRNRRAEGVVVVGDEPRPDWDETITRLGERGLEIVVLTGDDEEAAAYFGRHEHVDRVFAGVPPEAKAETVGRLRTDGQTVMIGDGTNDAPALARADLGIALGSGTAMAADAADIAIVDDDLASIETVFELSTAAGMRVKQNIGWAFLYNAIAIPIAVAGLLNPLFAALAMATSSALVVTNSSRDLLDEE